MTSFVGVDNEGVRFVVVAEVASMLCLSCSISTRCFPQVMKGTGATRNAIDLAGRAKVWRSFYFHNIP